MSNRKISWRFRPLTAIETSCLMILVSNDSYVYDIACAIKHDTNNKLTPTSSTVSQALVRMEGQGMVKIVNMEYMPHEDLRVGRYYGLTEFGESQLAMEIERMADVVADGRYRLGMRREAEDRRLELSELKLSAYGL
jgi:DNA-binding PadR family transcriptional regulator